MIRIKNSYALTLLIFVTICALVLFITLRAPAVDVALPQRGPATTAVYATGTVEPTVMLPVAARVTARLTELLVDEGAQVEEGQLLAQLEDDDLRSTLLELRSRESLSRADYERNKALVSSGAVSTQVFDRSKSEWESARAAAALAKTQVNFTKLTANARGTIIKRDGEIGELIPANRAVFWISGQEPLRIAAEVDEEDISLVAVGQRVLIRADAFPTQVFEGKVAQITPKGDPVGRSYRVRIALLGETPLRIGMTAEANIVIAENERALLVPTAALDKKRILVLNGDRVSERAVVTGAQDITRTEIVSGLSEGEYVVLNPLEVKDTSGKVRARPREAPPL